MGKPGSTFYNSPKIGIALPGVTVVNRPNEQRPLCTDGRMHPVEVKTSFSQNDPDLFEEKKRGCRNFKLCVIILVIIAFALGFTALIYFFIAYHPFSGKTEEPAKNEANSENDLWFNHWYLISRRGNMEEFDFETAIKKELIKHYDDVIAKNHPRYLKQFFNYNYANSKNIFTEDDLLDFLILLNSNKLDFYVNKLKDIKNTPIELTSFRDFFDLIEEHNFWYDYLHDLREFLSSYDAQINRDRYTKNVNEENFVTFVEASQSEFSSKKRSRKFVFNERRLDELNDVISELTTPITIISAGDKKAFQNKIIVLSEVKKMLEDFQTDTFRNVYVFATKMLYLDTDLILPGVNLAMISPRWVYVKNVTFDLSGSNGVEHERKDADVGEDGKPGNPGENGGYFIGIGNVNDSCLIVKNNGGNGSNGQNGADGIDGINGGNPNSIVEKPTCVILDSSIMNRYNEKVTYYDVYDDRGCGGSGTDGGVAGIGGEGGRIFLIDSQLKSYRVIDGVNGTDGTPGKGGKEGKGGTDGCFLKALTVDSKPLWKKVSKTICKKGNKMPDGKPGEDNKNSKGLILAPKRSRNAIFSNALFEYRSLARQYFIQYNDEDIISFLNDVDDVQIVYNFTDPRTLFEEMEQIQKVQRVEFYESLKKRIESFVNHSNNWEYKKALNHLKLLVLGKLLNIKYGFGNCLIIDLENHLKSVIDNMYEIDNTTLHREEHVKPILKENFQNKLKEIDKMIKKQNKNLKKTYLELSNSVRSLSKNQQIFEKDQLLQMSYFRALAVEMDARRITYIALIVCRSVESLVQNARNRLSDKEVKPNFHNIKKVLKELEDIKEADLKSALNVTKIEAESFEDALNAVFQSSLSENSGDVTQKQNVLLLSQILIHFDDFREGRNFLANSSRFSKMGKKRFRNYESKIISQLKILSDENLEFLEIRRHVEKLKSLIYLLNKAYRVNDEGKEQIEGLIDELDHFITVLIFVESYYQEEYLAKSLDNLESFGISDFYKETKAVKERLYNVLIVSQYKHALDAFFQWVFPYSFLYNDLSKPTEELTMNEALDNIMLMRRRITDYKNTIASFDENIREAIFSTNSTTGEFYVWHNNEIRDKLKDLFKGEKITLRSDIENIHILNKNAIKFKTIRVEFRPRGSSSILEIEDLLKNFAVELTHSGYSYYYYRGETYIITSDEVTLYYSYKTKKNGDPEIKNQVYKKLENGDAMLSPYTTWSVQLQQPNIAGNYDKLEQLADKVDIVLVGSGTYIAETNEDDSHPRIDESYRPIRRDELL